MSFYSTKENLFYFEFFILNLKFYTYFTCNEIENQYSLNLKFKIIKKKK